MTSGDLALAFIASEVIVAGLVFWLIAHIRYKDGYEAGRLDERGLHHKPARTPPPPTILMDTGRHAPWEPRLSVATARYMTIGGRGPTALTAPIRHDSGELRALFAQADQYITRMQADEDAWRRTLVTR